MAPPKHTNTPECEACRQKLWKVHPDLVRFAMDFRVENKDAHIAWGFRGKEDQEAVFKAGNSNAHWGESPHNYGLALDWFRLTHTGADWNRQWFIDKLAPAALSYGLVWGGDWKSLKDYPHVELKDWKKLI